MNQVTASGTLSWEATGPVTGQKTCRRCGGTKRLEDFVPERRNRDGRTGTCRTCILSAQETRRSERAARTFLPPAPAWKLCHRCGQLLPGDAFGVRRREVSGRNDYCRECCAARNRKSRVGKPRSSRQSSPEERSAHHAVERAIRRRHLTRPAHCTRCGRSGAIDAHHPDYSRPLDVVWLCRSCHAEAHHTDEGQR